MEKKCSCCGSIKPRTEYQKRAMSKDGLTASCKSCLSARDAKRFREDPKVKARHMAYQATEAGRVSMAKAKEKWRATNPDKRAAHVILGNAVRNGRVHKPDTCSVCGSGGRIHGHHHDYSKPLDVEWLCPRCHTKAHKELT